VHAAWRSALPLFALTVLINLLVSREGLTVFARLGEWGPLGQVDLTVQALVYGLVFGLRLLIVLLACLLVVCAADPDELLLSSRRFSPRSALTVALATRLIPVLGADARRLAEAQRCRPDGGARGAAGGLAIVRASVGGALDRALDVAAVLEMRGYGAPSARPRGRRERKRARGVRARSRHDLAFTGAAAGLLVLSLLAALSGAAPFKAEPRLAIALDGRVYALCALLLVIALAPFLDRRGIEP
jgi:energy-coupling factor transport system permease protein